MIQTAIVVSVNDDQTIMVRYPNPRGDKSLTSRSFWNVKERPFPVENPCSLSLKKGEMVKILVEPKGAIKAGFMIFIVPLIGFILLYSLISQLTNSEGLLFISGSIGLAGGFLLNVFLKNKNLYGKLPTIESKMSPEEIMTFKECNTLCKTCKGCG